MTEVIPYKFDVAQALATFSPADAEIERLRTEYMPLKINGLADRTGYVKVHDARMVVKNYRVAVEKTRTALKADALNYGRMVDAEAKRITALLEPIEDHLGRQEEAIEIERERIKAEAEAARKRRLDDRMAALAAVGHLVAPSEIEPMADDVFANLLAGATTIYREAQEIRRREAEAEAKRIADEAEAKRVADEAASESRRQEDARLAAERAKLEADRKAHEEAERVARAEREAFEAEKRREALARQAREEAERVRIAAEREAEARKAHEAEIEARRPVTEKLEAFASRVEALQLPDVDRKTQSALIVILTTAADAIRRVQA